MIFTENRYDRSIEKMMKGIPNFYPRGSGIVVTGNFRYTAEMCDCKYCGYYGGKKKGCLVPKCVCLEERISVGVASVKEIMNDTMNEIKHSGFLRRLKRYIKESEAKTLDVGNATVTVTVSENKITLTPSAGKLNASGRAVLLSATKTGIPSSNEAKLIAYASSYQDVVSGGSALTSVRL